MKNKKIALLFTSILIMGTFTGCMRKPYDKPEFTTIAPSQTAFLIPLVGDGTKQGAFQSEALLEKVKVATKEVQIPHRWVQLGRYSWDGEYRKSATLVLVERKPSTRNWTSDTSTGTNSKNEGIKAETKESIAFSANFNCTAQVDETEATKFLYRYNSTTLDMIMDTEIHSMVSTLFAEKCSTYTLEQLLLNKGKVMNEIRNEVKPYFAKRGVTITALGIAGDFTYTNPAIQEAIDNKFKTQKALESQIAENERVVSKAKADSQAVSIQANTIASQIKLKELEVEGKKADAMIEMGKNWKPSVIGGNSLIQLPTVK